MKSSFLCLVCALILFHLALPGSSQAVWKQYNGPFAGEITSLASYQGSFYIGSTVTGIFKSDDGGKTWAPTIRSLTYTHSLFNDGDSLLIGTNQLLSYTDSTRDLVQLGQEIPGYIEYIHRMNGKLFVCTAESIYRYDPISNLLVEKNDGILLTEPIRWTRNLVSIDGVLFCNSFVTGVYKSLDDGDHWEKVNVQNEPRGFMALITHGDSLLCVADRVYLSTDKGQSWKNINYNLPVTLSTNLAIRKDQLFVTTLGGVFSLEAGSTSWVKADDGFYFTIMVAKEKMFTSDPGGLYRWNSVSNKFIPSNKGINTSRVTDIEEFNGKLYSGTHAGLHFTTPGSDNWQVVPELRSHHVLAVAKSKSTLWVATSKGLYFSSIGDPVFNKVGGLPASYIMDIEVLEDRMYATTENDVYVSYNEGTSWHILPNTVKAADAYIEFISANDSMLVVGTTKGLYKILPDSSNWMNVDFFTSSIFSLNLINGIMYASEMNRSIYRSRDYGVTWELSGIPGYNRMDMIKRGTNIYAATYNEVYYSPDNGDSWDPFYETGIPDVMINCIAAGRNSFYVGTYGKSIWSRPFFTDNDIQSPVYRIENDTIYDINPAITLAEFQENVSVSYGASIELEIINESDEGSENYIGVNRVKIIAENGTNKRILNVDGAPGGPVEPDEPIDEEIISDPGDFINPDDPEEPEEGLVTKVSETEELKIEIYPVPSYDKLFITQPELLVSWQIITGVGQKLPQQELHDGYIDISHLPRGIYFLVISDKAGKPQRLKFLKD